MTRGNKTKLAQLLADLSTALEQLDRAVQQTEQTKHATLQRLRAANKLHMSHRESENG